MIAAFSGFTFGSAVGLQEFGLGLWRRSCSTRPSCAPSSCLP
jgi:hypothetical protein